MLFLAVVALVMPAVFDLVLYGSLEAQPPQIESLSFCDRGRADRRLPRQPDLRVHRAARSVPAGAGRERHAGRRCRPAQAIALLAIGTVLTTIQAEMLVGTLRAGADSSSA